MLGKQIDTSTYVTASQVLRRLAETKNQGADFYTKLKEGTKEPWVRQFAGMMARAEARHGKRFLEYASRAERGTTLFGNSLAAPLPAGVVSMLNDNIMPPAAQVYKSAPYATEDDILKLAAQAEESLAELLSQVRSHVPADQRRYIDRVIKEEWKHKESLELLRKGEYEPTVI